jgi:hypothetical protein
MRPRAWQPPVELSPAEQTIIKAIKRAKLFIFLRLHRHQLFDEAFQDELAGMYDDAAKGHPPVPPAQLALALILQAYAGVSDDEVIEATIMDRRWQLVLDCLDTERPPFAKGTLVGFRQRLIEANMDRRLIERTIEIAQVSGGFGPRALRAALDSSPLWGAGRVEDTWNLMGHALRKAMGVIARQQGWGLAEGGIPEGTAVLAGRAGAPQLAASSLKAALDLDWDDPAARGQALATVLECLAAVESFIAAQPAGPVTDAAAACVAVATQVRDQDVVGALRNSQSANNIVECGHIRASNFERRVWCPAADGRHTGKKRGTGRRVLVDMRAGVLPGSPRPSWPAAVPGQPFVPPSGRGIKSYDINEHHLASWLPLVPDLTPHGLRHSHSTWMAEDRIDGKLRDYRMGHSPEDPETAPQRMRDLYTHISDVLVQQLLDALQARWERSLSERAGISPHSPVPVLDRLLKPYRDGTKKAHIPFVSQMIKSPLRMISGKGL